MASGDATFTTLDQDEPEGPLLLLLGKAEERSEESLHIAAASCM